jgi:hypothetical protein
MGDPVGQQKFNSLQVKANKRLSGGLTMFGFVTWMKSFTMVLDQYPGNRLFQLDANSTATRSPPFWRGFGPASTVCRCRFET